MHRMDSKQLSINVEQLSFFSQDFSTDTSAAVRPRFGSSNQERPLRDRVRDRAQLEAQLIPDEVEAESQGFQG